MSRKSGAICRFLPLPGGKIVQISKEKRRQKVGGNFPKRKSVFWRDFLQKKTKFLLLKQDVVKTNKV